MDDNDELPSGSVVKLLKAPGGNGGATLSASSQDGQKEDVQMD